MRKELLFFFYISTLRSLLALRFATEPVTSSSGFLIVGKITELTCNYIKFRTESVRDISWYMTYNGVKTRIFHYKASTGIKNGSMYPFVTTFDDESATEKSLKIILNDFRDIEVIVSCDVQVLRDNGYGKVQAGEKMGSSLLKVVSAANIKLSLETEVPRIIFNEPFEVRCLSMNAQPPPALTLFLGSQNASDFESEAEIEYQVINSAEARLLIAFRQLPQVFLEGDDYLVVECRAHYDHIFIIKKSISIPIDKKNTLLDRAGKNIGYSNSNVVTESFLDNKNVARHIHPGIPYDFYSGYILCISEMFDGDENEMDESKAFVTLVGTLPEDLKDTLRTNYYGRFNTLRTEKHKLKIQAIHALNLLGNLDYRVIGTTSGIKNGRTSIIWTLERRQYEKILGRKH